MRETDLYLPVKRHLEAQGYEVKAEVRGCDVVALRSDDTPVIVELKTSMSLALIFQAVERMAVSDHVYVAIGRPKRGVGASALKLCRRIGLGLIVVSASGSIEVMADPVPYAPRANTKKRGLLLKEFNARSGDPNIGGSNKTPLMTAYRQDAIKCAQHLAAHGPTRIRDVRDETKVDRAAGIFRDNVYGWFERVSRGVFELTENGREAVLAQQR